MFFFPTMPPTKPPNLLQQLLLTTSIVLAILCTVVVLLADGAATTFSVECTTGAPIASMGTATSLCPSAIGKRIAVPWNSAELLLMKNALMDASKDSAMVAARRQGGSPDDAYWRWSSSSAFPNRVFYYRTASGTQNVVGTWPLSLSQWTDATNDNTAKVTNGGHIKASSYGSDSCVLCEVRPCESYCDPTGTSITAGINFATGCNCTCKTGYIGDDCSYQQKIVCREAPDKIINFKDAVLTCRAIDAYVATPKTKTELGDITQQFVNGDDVIIGGSDEAVEGTWRWIDGPRKEEVFWQGGPTGTVENGNQLPFATGEPGNSGGLGPENYVTISMRNSYPYMNDLRLEEETVYCVACQLTTNCLDLCGAQSSGSIGNIADGTCNCQCTGGYRGKYCRCPPMACDPRGGDVIEEINGCICVCRPTYSGADCSYHTATPPITKSDPITKTTTLLPTATLTSQTQTHSTTPSSPITSTASSTASKPKTQSLSRTQGTYSHTTTSTTSQSLSTTPTGLTNSYSASITHSATNTASQSTSITATPSTSLTVSKGTSTETISTTITPTTTLSAPITETGTLSTTLTEDVTPTKTLEATLSCGHLSWLTACDALTWELSDGNVSLVTEPNTTDPTANSNYTTTANINVTLGRCMPSLYVPYNIWERGDVRAAIRFPPSRLLPRSTPPLLDTNDVGAPAPLVTISSLADFSMSGGQVLEVVLQRRDEASLSRVAHTVKLPNWLFGCGLPFALVSEVVYEARPRNTAIKDIQDASTGVGTASSVLTGSPGAVVRGGVMSTVSGLMRCDGVDVTEEVSWLNNPPGLLVGEQDGASLRGSIVFGTTMVGLGLIIVAILVSGIVTWVGLQGEIRPGWRELIARGRLPSSVVAVVALSMEIGTGSAMTLLTMGTEFGSIGDRIGGAIYIVAAAVYCGHVCSTCIRAPVHAVETPQLPDQSSTLRKVAKYLFEPTHELELIRGDEGEDDESKKTRKVRDREWVRRNAFYTADLRWPLFRGIELYVGLAANLVEGFAANSTTACLVQIILIIATLVGTVVLLLVTRAFSIRAMLWTTVLLNALMAVAAVLALVNVMAVSPVVEEAADWLLILSSIIIAIQSTLDIVLSAVTVIPATRACFSYLRKRFGEDVAGDEMMEEGDDEEMHAPLLNDGEDDLDEPEDEQLPRTTTEIDVEELEFVEDVSHRLVDAPLEHNRQGATEEEELDLQIEMEYGKNNKVTTSTCSSAESSPGDNRHKENRKRHPRNNHHPPITHDDDLADDLFLWLGNIGFNEDDDEDDR